jgi:hypothetical protein
MLAALGSSACGGKSAERDVPNSQGAVGGSDGALAGNAGTTSVSDGGATSAGGTAGGALEDAGGAGSNQMPGCAKVTCPAIPNSCRKFAQDPNDCCPTCLDTGCEACPAIKCREGTHPETVPGDCCPSCVTDPPDACAEGRKTYAELRQELLDKYRASGCQNSADCALVLEDDACAYGCNVALPSSTSGYLVPNLNEAASRCSSCEPPARQTCENQLPSCVNGQCVGVKTLER